MIAGLQEFFHARVSLQGTRETRDEALRLAAAALLFEAAISDYELGAAERETIKKLVAEQFNISDAETVTLIELAEQAAKEATGLHGFTSLINTHWDESQRVTLVDQMWRVVYADGRLDDHELHLMRKIQRLLHIPHAEYVAAKLRHKSA